MYVPNQARASVIPRGERYADDLKGTLFVSHTKKLGWRYRMTEGRRFKMSADGRHLGPSHEECLKQRRQAVFLCMTAEGVFRSTTLKMGRTQR